MNFKFSNTYCRTAASVPFWSLQYMRIVGSNWYLIQIGNLELFEIRNGINRRFVADYQQIPGILLWKIPFGPSPRRRFSPLLRDPLHYLRLAQGLSSPLSRCCTFSLSFFPFSIDNSNILTLAWLVFTWRRNRIVKRSRRRAQKIDENMWKNREYMEEILFLLDKSRCPPAVSLPCLLLLLPYEFANTVHDILVVFVT